MQKIECLAWINTNGNAMQCKQLNIHFNAGYSWNLNSGMFSWSAVKVKQYQPEPMPILRHNYRWAIKMGRT
jgi:hypothetical protein